MTFTAQYTNAGHTTVSRSDMPGSSIPVDLGNRHYAEIVDAGVTIAAYAAPAPTGEDVNAERARRIEAGVIINVTGYAHAIHVTCRNEDRHNLSGLAFTAQERIGAGDTTTLTTFRDGADVMHDLTPPQIVEMRDQSMAYVEAVYAASWTLKAMSPIPADYATNATYWPASGL